MPLLKTESAFITMNGRQIPVTIEYSWHYDYAPIEDMMTFETDEEKQTYFKKFERGELINACLVVIAKALGLEGFDTLSSNHVEFNHLEIRLLQTAQDYEMRKIACEELVKNIQNSYNVLKEALEG